MKNKYSIPFLLTCIAFTNSFAQPTIREQKTIGGRYLDYLESICITKDGGLIAGGSSSSNISGEKTQNSRGGKDYWVVKLDKFNKIQWDKTIGGNEDDFLQSLQQTTDGGYILGGYSYSSVSGEKTENSMNIDYWVVKLDSLGNVQWDKTIGGNENDYLTSLQQTKKGDYILGGYSYSDSSGEKTQHSRGVFDYWVVKLDSLGGIIWDRTIGGTGQDYLRSIQQTIDGGYILGGYSSSGKSKEKTHNSRGGYDYWLVKLDAKGHIQWDKTIGGSSDDFLRSLQQTSDSGYILGGSSSSYISGEKTEQSRGGSDYWVVKLNSSAHIEWDKTIGGSSDDYFRSLEQTSDLGYILGGYSESNSSGEKTENSRGLADYWVVKTNKRGVNQWDKTIGGSSEDRLSTIKESAKNSYVLGGFSSSEVSGDKTEPSRGAFDYWIVFLDYKSPDPIQISSIRNESSFSTGKVYNNFVVYPNPTRNTSTVEFSGNETAGYVLQVSDLTGKILWEKEGFYSAGNNTIQLDVGRFAQGMYLVNIIDENGKRTVKLNRE